LQLWNDAADTTNFDDVTIATPTSNQTAPPQAEQNGGGWVQIVLHDRCATNCTGDEYSTTPALLDAFVVDWLEPRASNGIL